MNNGMVAKSLTMQEIQSLGDTDNLYVLNKSCKFENLKPGGDINIEIKVNDEKVGVVIPNTWIPWNVGASVPVRELIKSPKFRNFITSGVIVAITEASAKSVLKQPSAQAELKAVNSTLSQLHKNVMEEIEGGTVSIDVSTPRRLETLSTPEEHNTGVCVSAMEIVHKEDISDEERFAMVLSQERIFKEPDWNYLLAHIKYDKIINLAKKHTKKD